LTTPYTDIYDLFLMQVKDYNLINLYNTSVVDFNTYLQGWLIFSIVDFENICTVDLTKRNDSTGVFNVTLSDADKTTLAILMIQYWLAKEVEDIMQMNLHVQDKDFKLYSEAQNLTAKTNNLIMIKEQSSQRLQSYAYHNNDWSKWFAGNFSGE
jgi:hypothetical protein